MEAVFIKPVELAGAGDELMRGAPLTERLWLCNNWPKLKEEEGVMADGRPELPGFTT